MSALTHYYHRNRPKQANSLKKENCTYHYQSTCIGFEAIQEEYLCVEYNKFASTGISKILLTLIYLLCFAAFQI